MTVIATACLARGYFVLGGFLAVAAVAVSVAGHRRGRSRALSATRDRQLSGLHLATIEALPATRDSEIRLATVWWKPARNRTTLKPDYWLHETAQWLVFPHEMSGLEPVEVLRNKPGAEALAAWMERED